MGLKQKGGGTSVFRIQFEMDGKEIFIFDLGWGGKGLLSGLREGLRN